MRKIHHDYSYAVAVACCCVACCCVFTGLRSLAAADGAFEAGIDHCQGLCCSLVTAGCHFHSLYCLYFPLQGWDNLQQRMRPKRRLFYHSQGLLDCHEALTKAAFVFVGLGRFAAAMGPEADVYQCQDPCGCLLKVSECGHWQKLVLPVLC